MTEPGRDLQSALAYAAGSDKSLIFLDRKERETRWPFHAVQSRARAVAGRLMKLGIQHGERVVLVFPTDIEFMDAFFGCLLAGAVPTPVYPPVRLGRMDEYVARTARMIELAGARLVLAPSRIRRVMGRVAERARPELGCRTLEQLPSAPPDSRPVDPLDLALVQFSSGTTVDPKPVALTHHALMEQGRLLRQLILESGGDEVQAGCSWLPLYHDMGLIGCLMPALLHPGDLTLLGPELFITKPALWLRALSRSKATVSPAPNFAYALCVQKVKDEEMEGVDLSHWRMALNGAEPVAPEVLRAFTERFARWGFSANALTPVYGLSEAALAISFSDVNTPFVTTHFDPVALSEGRAVPDPEGVELVSVGKALPEFDIEVREGIIWTRGPSLMKGYLGRPDLTATALVDGWLNTGDLGFFHEGELYVTGREKDVLILNGRNHAPHPVEQAADHVQGVRTGCAAAVSFRPEGAASETLVLFVERNKGATVDPSLVAASVLERCGLRCGQVVIVDPGTLPRTSSGKLRRSEALRLHRAGELAAPDEVTLLHVAGIFARSAAAFFRAR
mgnify:CR=1 FL=1